MAAVEFLAFGAYVRKVFRRDEDDDGDQGTPAAQGLRCRVWSKDAPGAASYKKNKTFLLDLTKHPGATPNFTTANAAKLHCDAPGYTGIGMGTPTTPSFENGDDFLNRVYLNSIFWNALPAAVKPAFPPMQPVALPGRAQPQGPMDFEFKSQIFASDDADVPRRNRRYLGYYADVISKVAGSVNTWNVKVFHWADAAFEDYQLDFTDPSKFAPQTTITPNSGSSGALYLDSVEASNLQMSLPKIPPGQSFAGVPFPIPPSPQGGARILVPTASYVQQLVQKHAMI